MTRHAIQQYHAQIRISPACAEPTFHEIDQRRKCTNLRCTLDLMKSPLCRTQPDQHVREPYSSGHKICFHCQNRYHCSLDRPKRSLIEIMRPICTRMSFSFHCPNALHSGARYERPAPKARTAATCYDFSLRCFLFSRLLRQLSEKIF